MPTLKLSLCFVTFCSVVIGQEGSTVSKTLVKESHPDALLVAWDVMPPAVVRDNYGRYTARSYFGIDVAVQNSSAEGESIIVNSFIFQHEGNGALALNLTTDPRMVRGSIEKGGLTGRRNTTVNIIKTLGVIATGAGGFFKAAGSAASYNRSVAIFSDPFEKGFELIFPDTTIKYLANWDADEVFKKGFVVGPGQTVRGRVFIPIQAVFPDYKERSRSKSLLLDILEVKKRLGELIIFGQQIKIQNDVVKRAR